MINACHVKLKIGIELHRTTKHENSQRIVFIYAEVTSKRKEGQEPEAQSHRESCGV